ncbi:MAG: glycosyl transferase [Verrucomicrobiaceae bacterium]|nr:glycosyl transferase [Verrucomicrobiaceae bacterium]
MLLATLDRIAACVPRPSEILVHADGGWESGIESTQVGGIPLRLITSKHRIGPGGGRDLMIRAASQDIVASFDDDSWPVDSDYFARAFALMNAFPLAAVASPAVYLHEKPVQEPWMEATEAGAFEGSASLTRRSLYLQLPGYVPVPAAYGIEEVDVSLQAHAAGFQILACPWLRAWHDRPQADDQHGMAPWAANEVLLAYLRYPRWLQPWGWWRAVRRILHQWSGPSRAALLAALAGSPAHCARFAGWKRRYSWREIHAFHRGARQRWCLSVRQQSEDAPPALQAELAPPPLRVAFVQYTNPAAYPPLMNGSKLLAKAGVEILFVGLKGPENANFQLPSLPRICQRSMSVASPGFWQKVHYLQYSLLVLWCAWRFQARWLYVSDAIGCGAGLLARRVLRIKTVYHEHDASPGLGSGRSRADSLIAVARNRMAGESELLVAPNQDRLDLIISQVARTGPSLCVWNSPVLSEIGPARQKAPPDAPFRLVFHGSIVPERFPLRMIQALAGSPENVILRLVGYEGPGVPGYVDSLIAEASRLGVGKRFEYLGTLQRPDCLKCCGECDAGLCLLTHRLEDINSVYMAGASNKPFDYLSQGVAVVVPDDETWRNLFVASGFGVTSNILNTEALASTFTWLVNHREEVRAMGERGRQKILAGWNYETVFAPALDFMLSSTLKRP